MCDDPYYYADGRAYRLKTVERERVAETERNTSNLHPDSGLGIKIAGQASGVIRPRAERLGHDTDTPLTIKCQQLSGRFPYLPGHTVRILVHDSPEMSVDQLSEIVALIPPEEILLNSERAVPEPPPAAPPALPDFTVIAETGALVAAPPRRNQRRGRPSRVQHEGGWSEKRRGEEWACARCSLVNAAAADFCAACDAAAPTPKPWMCARCSRVNPPADAQCPHCATPKPANAPAAAVSATGPGAGEPTPFPFRTLPPLLAHTELQPGLVLIKGMMDIKTQQWVADEALRLGNNPPGLSGGFYRVLADGTVELNQHHRGVFSEKIDAFAPHFKEVCMHFFRHARPLSRHLPEMIARYCAFNFYSERSPGLQWHVDGDSSRNRGQPVLSLSLGDSCDFRWKNNRTEDDNVVRLDSGDVLIFGGPSRRILHSVTRIHPNTKPKLLQMRSGRLNLTYRD